MLEVEEEQLIPDYHECLHCLNPYGQ